MQIQSQNDSLVETLFQELQRLPIYDPHSHIVPTTPVARDLNDILGYHYYTELAHSAGLARDMISNSSGPELAEQLVQQLQHCSNTVQVSWLLELVRTFYHFQESELTPSNIGELWQHARQVMAEPNWEEKVIRLTNLEAIFLTNDFDDPLTGFDTQFYIPCLRTDDLVFKLGQSAVQERFERATGKSPSNWQQFSQGLDHLFEHFVQHEARACAISLPPDFAPLRPGSVETASALEKVLQQSASAEEQRTLAYAIFYALADRCETYHLPFDLMVGVYRNVYEGGVYQGQDLFDNRTSLYSYRQLFNEKSPVAFPISVLTHQQNQELVSYSWIFPNVYPNGHWWYSNIPGYIEADLRLRLEAVPANKLIGYYSDAYKLEFVLPKFNMFRRCLARVLANDLIRAQGWSETRALELARTILQENPKQLFRKPVRS